MLLELLYDRVQIGTTNSKICYYYVRTVARTSLRYSDSMHHDGLMTHMSTQHVNTFTGIIELQQSADLIDIPSAERCADSRWRDPLWKRHHSETSYP
jgi:adenylosuccinate synthase